MKMTKQIILTIMILAGFQVLTAQVVYTIKADSVKITNCDSAELIIENHTQGVPGFLYNTYFQAAADNDQRFPLSRRRGQLKDQ
jgi:hypothetical protein